jgi:hypothetical protein
LKIGARIRLEVNSMSAYDETQNTAEGQSAEAEAVRKLFAALPFDQRVSALFHVELDLVADVVETVAANISKAVEDFADSCTGSATSSTGTPNPGESIP